MIAKEVIEGAEVVEEGFNMGSNIKVAKLPVFNGETEKAGGFITACRLYLRIKIREISVKEQV